MVARQTSTGPIHRAHLAKKSVLADAARARAVPGITVAGGPTGRRARIAGTGIEVFEVIAEYVSFGRDVAELEARFHWLSKAQLQAALRYYELYQAEIDAQVAEQERWDPEHGGQHYPLVAGQRS